jgi:hypothetical protein
MSSGTHILHKNANLRVDESASEARLVAKLGAIFWGDIFVDIPGPHRPNIDQISPRSKKPRRASK